MKEVKNALEQPVVDCTIGGNEDNKKLQVEQCDETKTLQEKLSKHRQNVLKKNSADDTKNNISCSVSINISTDLDSLAMGGVLEHLVGSFSKISNQNEIVINITDDKPQCQYQEEKNPISANKMNEVKQTIVEYIERFLPVIFEDKHEKWMALWDALLEDESLKDFFLSVGRQKFAENEIPFNRKGVINVVGFLKNNYPQLFSEQRNTEIALVVEASRKHPMRQQLGGDYKVAKNDKENIKRIYNEIFK